MTQVAVEVPKQIQDVLEIARKNNPVSDTTQPVQPAEPTAEPTEPPTTEPPAALPAQPVTEPAPVVTATAAPPAAEPAKSAELSDEELIEMLKKRNITLPKEEDPIEKAEVVRNEAITWGLTNKKIALTDVEEYNKVKKESPIELAFQVYKESRKGEIDDNQEELTDEILREDFEMENFLYEDDGDPRKERAIKRLKQDAENFIKDKFGKVDSIESEYHSTLQQEGREKIISTAKQEAIANGILFVHKDDDGTEINVKIPVNQKIAEEISTSLANSNVQLNPEEGVDPTDYLKRIFNGALLASNPAAFMHEYATAYHAEKMLRYEASGRGIEHKQTVVQANLGDVPEQIRTVLEEARARQKSN